MARFQLFEIHEQTWCPKPIRDAITDYLQFMANWLRFYRGIIPLLAESLTKTGDQQVVDLCSGGSGPWIGMCQPMTIRLDRPIRILLTDKFPNESAFAYSRATTEECIDYCRESVDATAVPNHIGGFRTLFGSFHHFPPAVAAAILRDAVAKRQGIGIFEISERHPMGMLMEFLGAISSFFVAPFIRPFRWSRVLFSCVIPIVPLVLIVDGFVSCLRTYTPNELRELVNQADASTYDWQIGKVRAPWIGMRVTYLIACPK